MLKVGDQTHFVPVDEMHVFMETGHVRPSRAKWKERVSADALWSSFVAWLDVNCKMAMNKITRTGFFTVVYSVTGARVCRITSTAGRLKGAKF